jgi:23S rRNA (uracil1939-C5)-methyltransferase
LEPSPDQIEPPCPYFGICGGCQLQHYAYESQIKSKTHQVREILERLGGFESVLLLPAKPAEQIYHYRNKMEFTFSDLRWVTENDSGKPKDFALGLHVPRRFDKVLDIDGCLLQSETNNKILRSVKTLALETELKPYNIRNHTGFYRFCILRQGLNTGDIMLNIITSGQAGKTGDDAMDWISHKLFWNHPEITTFIHSISDSLAQVAFAEKERLLLGTGKITEKIGGRVFEISPGAFFQTISELADFQGTETVYDLYCGTGAIGISVSHQVKRVLGIEVIQSAVEDGKRNLELNHIENMEFVLADMKEAMKDYSPLIEKHGRPDVVILDPPRGGTHPDTVNGLLNLAPPKIVYVSCNPAILARDLKILCEKTYTLQTVQAVDMFPNTAHIEVVALLVRNSLIF